LLKFYFRLIQAALGSLTVQDFSLQQDTSRIFRAANRISRCNGLLDIFIYTSKNLNIFDKNKINFKYVFKLPTYVIGPFQ